MKPVLAALPMNWLRWPPPPLNLAGLRLGLEPPQDDAEDQAAATMLAPALVKGRYELAEEAFTTNEPGRATTWSLAPQEDAEDQAAATKPAPAAGKLNRTRAQKRYTKNLAKQARVLGAVPRASRLLAPVNNRLSSYNNSFGALATGSEGGSEDEIEIDVQEEVARKGGDMGQDLPVAASLKEANDVYAILDMVFKMQAAIGTEDTSLGARLASYEAELRAKALELDRAESELRESESGRESERELDLSRVFAEGERERKERERESARARVRESRLSSSADSSSASSAVTTKRGLGPAR